MEGKRIIFFHAQDCQVIDEKLLCCVVHPDLVDRFTSWLRPLCWFIIMEIMTPSSCSIRVSNVASISFALRVYLKKTYHSQVVKDDPAFWEPVPPHWRGCSTSIETDFRGCFFKPHFTSKHDQIIAGGTFGSQRRKDIKVAKLKKGRSCIVQESWWCLSPSRFCVLDL